MDSFQFPAWYQSSAGPGISKTIFNMAGALLPVINLFMSSTGHGVTIIPADLNSWISLAVFIYFCVQALIGYVRSKNIAQEKMKAVGSIGNLSIAQFNQITKV